MTLTQAEYEVKIDRLKAEIRRLKREKRDLQNAIDINGQTMQLLADRVADAELRKDGGKCNDEDDD